MRARRSGLCRCTASARSRTRGGDWERGGGVPGPGPSPPRSAQGPNTFETTRHGQVRLFQIAFVSRLRAQCPTSSFVCSGVQGVLRQYDPLDQH
eukprot:8487914-Alexandrium_andersonii.AAC.1